MSDSRALEPRVKLPRIDSTYQLYSYIAAEPHSKFLSPNPRHCFQYLAQNFSASPPLAEKSSSRPPLALAVSLYKRTDTGRRWSLSAKPDALYTSRITATGLHLHYIHITRLWMIELGNAPSIPEIFSTFSTGQITVSKNTLTPS